MDVLIINGVPVVCHTVAEAETLVALYVAQKVKILGSNVKLVPTVKFKEAKE